MLFASVIGGRLSPDMGDEAIKFRLPLSSDTSVHYYVDRDTSAGIRAWNGTTQTYNTHTGSDYSGGPQNRDIYAAADGIVIARVDGFANYSGPTGAAGNYVTLSHGNDRSGNPITTTYMHMTPGSPINVALGTFVAAGTRIGGVGASGGATGLHLHFHMTYNGVRYDPYAATGTSEVSWWTNQGSGSPAVVAQPRKFAVGDWVDAFALGGTQQPVRGPTSTGAVQGYLSEGLRGKIIGGPTLSYTGTNYASGVYMRWQIQFNNGVVGWAAQNYLTLSPGPAAVTAVTPTNGQMFPANAPPTTLDFTDSPGATSYDVYFDGALRANVATSSYTFPTAPTSGSHTWSVTARSAVGSTGSAAFSFYVGKFLPGETVRVNSPTGLRAWNTAASNGTNVVKPDNTLATVLSGPVYAVDNWRWELMYAGDSVARWSAENFLERVGTPPTIAAMPDVTVSQSAGLTASGSFTDPNPNGWSATVNYGDGTGVQPLALVGKTFSLSHVYTAVGTFPVTVVVNDSDGGSDSELFDVSVQGSPQAAVAVNNGAAQRSKVDVLTVAFEHAVTVANGAFALTRRTGSGSVLVPLTITAIAPDGSGRAKSYELRFAAGESYSAAAGSLIDGLYDLAITGANIQDVFGQTASNTTHTFHRF